MIEKSEEIQYIENIMVSNKLFEKFSLSRIGIFGSTARGEKSDDIDILIEDKVDYRLLFAFKDELQKLINKRVDIMMAQYANPIVLHRAQKEIVYVTRH